jgi:hypothetical protein
MMRLCTNNFSYQLMTNEDIFIYHLSHNVDKSSRLLLNKDLYEKKTDELGIKFHLNHFFGIFDDDEYDVITKTI